MDQENANEKIQKAFIQLLQSKELHEIKVTYLCKLIPVNRSTFYSNYLDIYDLAEKVTNEIENKYLHMVYLYPDKDKLEDAFLKLFNDVKKNSAIFKAYFKINPDKGLIFKEHSQSELYFTTNFLPYNSIFFRAGITAVIKLWLENNCMESSEEMSALIIKKYKF